MRPDTSWVIIRRANGEAVFETFDARIVARLNPDTAEAVPIGRYLTKLNARIKANGGCQT